MPLHFLTVDAADREPGDTVALTAAEAHHAATVRRVRVGEQVTVGDGAGVWLDGVVETADPRAVTVRIRARRIIAAPTPRLVLVQALAKGDRDELAVQAATELGVDAIVPWQAARSVSRWDGARAAKGRERWTTIVREAGKQAHRAWVPSVAAAVDTAQLADRGAAMLVLEPTATDPLTGVPWSSFGDDDIHLVVGPEGGIAPDELALLAGRGARAVRLGDTVLRTSTAGPAALAVACAGLGRW